MGDRGAIGGCSHAARCAMLGIHGPMALAEDVGAFVQRLRGVRKALALAWRSHGNRIRVALATSLRSVQWAFAVIFKARVGQSLGDALVGRSWAPVGQPWGGRSPLACTCVFTWRLRRVCMALEGRSRDARVVLWWLSLSARGAFDDRVRVETMRSRNALEIHAKRSWEARGNSRGIGGAFMRCWHGAHRTDGALVQCSGGVCKVFALV